MYKKGKLEIIKHWFSRIKKTDKKISDIVESAEYTLSLKLGDIPKDIKDIGSYLKTGLKWPK